MDRMSRRILPKSRCACQRPSSGGRSISCRVLSALTRRTSIDSTVTLGESIAVHRRLQYAIVHSALSSSNEKWPVLLLHGGGRMHCSALRRTAVGLISISFIAVLSLLVHSPLWRTRWARRANFSSNFWLVIPFKAWSRYARVSRGSVYLRMRAWRGWEMNDCASKKRFASKSKKIGRWSLGNIEVYP